MKLLPLLGALLIGAAAAFAFWPTRSSPMTPPIIDHVQPGKREVIPLNLAAFRTPIWIAKPPPPSPPIEARAPPPPAPLRLQLLAIIQEAEVGVYKAAVYDPDSDRILIVAAGDCVGSRTVEQVGRSSLTLSDQGGTRVLALNAEGGP